MVLTYHSLEDQNDYGRELLHRVIESFDSSSGVLQIKREEGGYLSLNISWVPSVLYQFCPRDMASFQYCSKVLLQGRKWHRVYYCMTGRVL